MPMPMPIRHTFLSMRMVPWIPQESNQTWKHGDHQVHPPNPANISPCYLSNLLRVLPGSPARIQQISHPGPRRQLPITATVAPSPSRHSLFTPSPGLSRYLNLSHGAPYLVDFGYEWKFLRRWAPWRGEDSTIATGARHHEYAHRSRGFGRDALGKVLRAAAARPLNSSRSILVGDRVLL